MQARQHSVTRSQLNAAALSLLGLTVNRSLKQCAGRRTASVLVEHRRSPSCHTLATVTTGRLLDDEEKQRCALLMQYKGKVPAYEIAAITSSNSRTSKPSLNGRRQHEQGSSSLECGSSSGVSEADGIRLRRQALQQRFTEAAEEVAEREEFIASMQQLGKLQMEHLNVIKAEVAAKVREMGQLHSQIKELDKQLQAV